jgi:hypothetical protein
MPISRRAFAGSAALFALGGKTALAQGFAGLGKEASGFAAVTPGKRFAFPADHGPHPDYRIEWWYVTANLVDTRGAAYGAQWTLFRQAMTPGEQQEGWANQQIWMGHAAVTRADTHRFSETFARGGVGQAGVELKPFLAWIDSWQMRGIEPMRDDAIAPLQLSDRLRIISASLISRRRAASPSTTGRPRSPGRPGWTGSGAASRSPRTRPGGTGSRCT